VARDIDEAYRCLAARPPDGSASGALVAARMARRTAKETEELSPFFTRKSSLPMIFVKA
jgi:hypothetical protein